MLVLLTAFLLLVGAPAALLVLGRAIARFTDFEGRRGVIAPNFTLETGEAWYFRRMRPAFKWVDESDKERAESAADQSPAGPLGVTGRNDVDGALGRWGRQRAELTGNKPQSPSVLG